MADNHGIVASQLGWDLVGNLEGFGCRFKCLHQGCIHGYWRNLVQLTDFAGYTIFCFQLFCRLLIELEGPVQAFLCGTTDLQGMFCFARDHIGGSRFCRNLADCGNNSLFWFFFQLLRGGGVFCIVVDLANHIGCGHQGIAPVFHGCGTGMVGNAFPGELVMTDAYDGRDNAQRQSCIFQGPPLFDMEFQEAFPRQQMGMEWVSFDTGGLQQFGQGFAVFRFPGIYFFLSNLPVRDWLPRQGRPNRVPSSSAKAMMVRGRRGR